MISMSLSPPIKLFNPLPGWNREDWDAHYSSFIASNEQSTMNPERRRSFLPCLKTMTASLPVAVTLLSRINPDVAIDPFTKTAGIQAVVFY